MAPSTFRPKATSDGPSAFVAHRRQCPWESFARGRDGYGSDARPSASRRAQAADSRCTRRADDDRRPRACTAVGTIAPARLHGRPVASAELAAQPGDGGLERGDVRGELRDVGLERGDLADGDGARAVGSAASRGGAALERGRAGEQVHPARLAVDRDAGAAGRPAGPAGALGQLVEEALRPRRCRRTRCRRSQLMRGARPTVCGPRSISVASSATACDGTLQHALDVVRRSASPARRSISTTSDSERSWSTAACTSASLAFEHRIAAGLLVAAARRARSASADRCRVPCAASRRGRRARGFRAATGQRQRSWAGDRGGARAAESREPREGQAECSARRGSGARGRRCPYGAGAAGYR